MEADFEKHAPPRTVTSCVVSCMLGLFIQKTFSVAHELIEIVSSSDENLNQIYSFDAGVKVVMQTLGKCLFSCISNPGVT